MSQVRWFFVKEKNGNFCFLSFLLFFSVLLSFGLITSLSGKESCVSQHFFSLAFELTYSFPLIV